MFKFNELNQQTHKYQPFLVTGTLPTTAGGVYGLLGSALSEITEYDALGKVEWVTDYKGQKTKYEYDGQGRLEYNKYCQAGQSTPAKTVQYVYDGLGREEQVIENDGTTRTTTYHYDSQGNIAQIDSPEGTIHYDCNSITNRKTRTWTTNSNFNYDYDSLGRLNNVELTKRNGGGLYSNEETSYHYDAVGNRANILIGSQLSTDISTTYTYDNCNRLTNLTNSHTVNGVLSSFTYGLYANGMRHTVSETLKYPGSVTETHNITYNYDNLNRLTGETADTNPSGHGYSQSYIYDLAGNRLTRTVIVNGQTLTTEYQYYTGTDKLHYEIHSGPVACLPFGNERYYAYANGGGINYRTSTGVNISKVKAFWMGLPGEWSRYMFGFVMALIPCGFFAPAVSRYRGRGRGGLYLALWKRCMCVLLVYLMLLTPGLESIAEGATQYSQLNTMQWASGNMTIEYQYDDNGSVTSKTTKETSTGTVLETVAYDYNLRNKLATITRDGHDSSDTWQEITKYTYDDEGARVKSHYYWTLNGGPTKYDEEMKVFLNDSYNHTGFTQTFEETTYDGSMNFVSRITYAIGDDVISHAETWATKVLLYDGQGSTRQVFDGSMADTHSYDGYGVMLGGNPSRWTPAQTNLLYTGEYFDNDLQQYNLRARYYDPLNGRFNQVDPYAGNNQDPQSLHKYLYCHANPINGIDPSGRDFSLLSVMSTMANIATTFMRCYPVLKFGLVVADILTATNIVVKAMTQGISSVTLGEWAQFTMFTGTVFFGGTVARQVAKGLISKALDVPAEIFRSFEGFASFIRSKGIILEIDDMTIYTSERLRKFGGFRLLGEGLDPKPMITLYKGGHRVSTLIHEYVHYRQWKYFVGGTRYDWDNFRNIENYDDYLEKIAYFVGDVFSK